MRTLTAFILLGLAAACGHGGKDGGPHPPVDNQSAAPDGTGSFTSDDQTPGLFRDTYKTLIAVDAESDDDVATTHLILDITHKLETASDLTTQLSEHDADTVKGLYLLSLRSMQATQHKPDVSRDIGEHILQTVLSLDPARVAWNQENANDQVDVATAGAPVVATAATYALQQAVNAPVDTTSTAVTDGLSKTVAADCNDESRGATWTPGYANSVWVAQLCYGSYWSPGYCESDTYVEGDCYDVWVSTGSCGDYEDEGYYDYVCDDDNSDDCDYEWTDRYVWVDDNCDDSDGYYEQECDSGHYEPGLCYADTYNPGYCIPGHYKNDYPSGTWNFYGQTTTCDDVVEAQYAVAQTTAKVLNGPTLAVDINDDSIQASLTALVAASDAPSGGYVAALQQIIQATINAPPLTTIPDPSSTAVPSAN